MLDTLTEVIIQN